LVLQDQHKPGIQYGLTFNICLLISDAWRAENWKDKFTIWFKPTGWRPENFFEENIQ
jgi:hypothetical protein